MTLPKRKSRSILVDAVRYRYVVSQSKSASQGDFLLNLTVQIASGRGCILKVQGTMARDWWLDFPAIEFADEYVVMKPGHIAAAIRRARTAGWEPSAPGTPFLLAATAADFAEVK